MSCKKKLHWHTTFGQIIVNEQTFFDKKTKQLIRPFSITSSVVCRGYSMKLQRAMTDFAAESSFGNAAKKIYEHYGITVPSSTTRLKVESHAEKMRDFSEKNLFQSSAKQSDCIIAQADGGMIPIRIYPKEDSDSTDSIDRRKNKTLVWKEALLSFARGHKTLQPYSSATTKSREGMAKRLLQNAELAGKHSKTRMYCLGDGAEWIATQMDNAFGSDATFLIDFYHLMQYLAKAAVCCQPDNPLAWIEKNKQLMLENQLELVMQNLQQHINDEDKKHKDCNAEKCFNYIDKRRNYFNYKDALEAKLPIGSGEVESGIRTIIQSRLKIPGAWWLNENADAMLSLKTVRANGFWEQYWNISRCGNAPNS